MQEELYNAVSNAGDLWGKKPYNGHVSFSFFIWQPVKHPYVRTQANTHANANANGNGNGNGKACRNFFCLVVDMGGIQGIS